MVIFNEIANIHIMNSVCGCRNIHLGGEVTCRVIFKYVELIT